MFEKGNSKHCFSQGKLYGAWCSQRFRHGFFRPCPKPRKSRGILNCHYVTYNCHHSTTSTEDGVICPDPRSICAAMPAGKANHRLRHHMYPHLGDLKIQCHEGKAGLYHCPLKWCVLVRFLVPDFSCSPSTSDVHRNLIYTPWS